MRDQEHRLASSEHEVAEIEAPEQKVEEESETKFSGKPPARAGADEGTAMLAYEEDSNERELKQKVGKLVTEKFDGDYKKAFTHYVDKKGAVGKSELVRLLSDAGVGNGLTRGAWASGIIDKLDRNDDKAIEWSEFESVFRARA